MVIYLLQRTAHCLGILQCFPVLYLLTVILDSFSPVHLKGPVKLMGTGVDLPLFAMLGLVEIRVRL